MMKSAGWGGRVGVARLVLAAILGAMALAPIHAGAQTPSPIQSRKLTRELGIMEKIIDQMLLDSQNFLVYSQPETRGLYLDEFGIVFSFQASLLNRDRNNFNMGDWNIKKDGDKWTIDKKKNKDDDSEDSDADNDNSNDNDNNSDKNKSEDDEATTDRLQKTWERSQSAREAKLYAQGKAEILDVLLDYGDTITTLRDNQWLAIAAYLKGSDYFMKNRISRLLMKAKAADIRAYAAGKLTRPQMLAKVVEEEY